MAKTDIPTEPKRNLLKEIYEDRIFRIMMSILIVMILVAWLGWGFLIGIFVGMLMMIFFMYNSRFMLKTLVKLYDRFEK